MEVKEVMVREPACCGPETKVGKAVELLRSRKCGFLPIVNSEEKVIGVVTDRDICMALGERNRLPADIAVEEIATKQVFSCMPDDDIRTALQTMARAKVRRLPVINTAGKLEGILSMDDIVLHAEGFSPGRILELSCGDVVDTLKRVFPPQPPREVLEPANRIGTE